MTEKKEIKVNFHEKPMCKMHLKYLLNDKLGCEDCGKEEVKLPEVGKRYRDKYGEFVVRDGERGYYNVDYNEGTVIHATNRYKMEDFWTFCEELPEDNIEKPDVKVGKIYKSLISKSKIEVIEINQKWQSIKYKFTDGSVGEDDFKEFFKYFKELT